MRRGELAATLADVARQHVVLTSLGSAGRAWREHGGDNPTFYGSDPMGAAPGFALGAAVAAPDRAFLLLEGDGDLSMNLGVLLAIADARPANLHVVVFANGRYETGGGQELAGHGHTDLAAIIGGAGWPTVQQCSEESGDDLRELLRAFLAQPGPAALVARVDQEDSPYGGPGEHSGAEARLIFRQQLEQWDRAGRTQP